MTKLKITEIYASIQGESTHAGRPCSFVRLTGCPLRCRWCDTAYGFEGGEDLGIGEICRKVSDLGLELVEITGGEPLAQPACLELMTRLLDKGHEVLLETGGSEDISAVDNRVRVIMDIKCPGSGMSDRNLWSNSEHLKPGDEVKFVIADRRDFEWACEQIDIYELSARSTVLMSCAFGLLEPSKLAEWMIERGCHARLNLQQHKYIWSPRAKGV